MSGQLDRLPQGALTRTVRVISQGAAEFKSRQRTTGRSGQLGYAVQSTADWDYTVAFPATPPSTAQNAELNVIFTGDGSQKFPIVVPASDIRVNGTGDANKLTLGSNGVYGYSSGGNVVQLYALDQPVPTYFEDETKLAWLIGISYMGSVTIRLKARGRSSSNGTWSVVRTV